MTTVLGHVLALASIVVPVGLAVRGMTRKTDDGLPGDPHAADAAFRAEREADARLQPFNGGAR